MAVVQDRSRQQTPLALQRMKLNNTEPWALLKRHIACDWTDMDADDRKANIQAVQYGARVLSSYSLSATERVWIITEADRSTTTFLMPFEY